MEKLFFFVVVVVVVVRGETEKVGMKGKYKLPRHYYAANWFGAINLRSVFRWGDRHGGGKVEGWGGGHMK